MRGWDAPYDPTLNKLSVNQDQAAKSIFEFVQALREAEEEGDGLEAGEIFAVAVRLAPAAASDILAIIKDTVPNGEDAYKVGYAITSQLQPFRPSEE